MVKLDNPSEWILRLFEMEEREGRGETCARFPEGISLSYLLPLEGNEKVFGIYKQKYYFTPSSLIIRDKSKTVRIPWGDIRSCSSKHGEGKTFSDLTLADGRTLRVKVGDMAKGWSGRISQLFHQMIEHYGQNAGMGKPLMPLEEFLPKATDDYSIAPNLEPHPTLESFRKALRELERPHDGTSVLLDLAEDEDESPVAQGVVVVTPRPREAFESFAKAFNADGVYLADENTIRLVGVTAQGLNVWHIIWD